MAQQYPRAKERKPTKLDEAQARVTAAVKRAIIERLRPLYEANNHFMIKDLGDSDIEGIAVDAVAAYTTAYRREKMRELLLDDDISDLYTI